MIAARWQTKAAALLEACRTIFGAPVPRRAIVLGLCVAEHETRCGDAWPGSNNWGAVQWRKPTGEELAQIEAGELQQGARIPGGILEVDSSPEHGKYWVWFRAFGREADGARCLAETLYLQRPGCRIVASVGGSCWQLARAMYLAPCGHYFEGVHDPRAGEPDADGLTPGGRANVNDYAHALEQLEPAIVEALAGWTADGLEELAGGAVEAPAAVEDAAAACVAVASCEAPPPANDNDNATDKAAKCGG